LISLHLSNNSITSENIIFDNLPATLTHLHLDRNSINQVTQNKLRYGRLLVKTLAASISFCCYNHSNYYSVADS
jgi:hypothetical protein